MPEYALKCPACELSLDLFLKMSERADARCPKCSGLLATDARQYQTQAIQREWHGTETTSFDIAFAKDADQASIKRDCPSMELKPDKFGLLRPTFRNDAHHRRCMGEFDRALQKHEAADKRTAAGGPS